MRLASVFKPALRSEYFYLGVTLTVIFITQIFGVFGEQFFRDNAILFDGAYRVSIGQFPYFDFKIPGSLLVFLLLGLFGKLVGINLWLMVTIGWLLSAILVIYFYKFIRPIFNIPSACLLSYLFYLSFLGITFFPWYNQFALFFFLLNLLILLVKHAEPQMGYRLVLISSILAIFSFYCKQDVGGLHFLLIFGYFLFNNFLGTSYKTTLAYVLMYILLQVLIVSFWVNTTDFEYWFNFGQPPHSSRLGLKVLKDFIFEIFGSWDLLIGVFFLILLLSSQKTFFSDKRLMLIFIILSTAIHLLPLVSGRGDQIVITGMPLLVVIVYLQIRSSLAKLDLKVKLVRAILVVFAFVALNPILFDHGITVLRNLSKSDYTRIDSGACRGSIIEKEHLAELHRLNEMLIANRSNFMNFTEYQFLDCDHNKLPVRQLPLWFDHGVTFFDQDIEKIKDIVNKNRPDIVLVQDAHEHSNPEIHNVLLREFREIGYHNKDTILAPSYVGDIIVMGIGQ